MSRKSYPLQWPQSWKRTDAHRRGVPKFETAFTRDRDSVIRQLRMRGGGHIVITSDLPTRADGLPYANARCDDPGIAVYWIQGGHEHTIACDRWRRVEQNLRAVEMSLEALRGLDRWGASEMVERAFAGFAALPPAPSQKRPWREVLGLSPLEGLFSAAKAKHREMIRVHHPDVGGDPSIAAALNAALDDAAAELGV